MNKAKRQPLLKYIASIYLLSSALFLWSCASDNSSEEGPPQTLKSIVEAGKIPTKSELSNTSQDLQDVFGPLAGDTAKSLGAIYVSVRGGSTTQDGSSWENAYNATSLKIAIDKAGKATSAIKPYLVLIAGGTYTIGESLHMKNDVAIIGGIGSGWNPAESILDGAGDTEIFNNSGVNDTAILYGLTITNGRSPEGGGIYNENSSPTLIRLTFSGNSADSGGGIFNFHSSPTLKQVTFSGNTADNYGGGIYNYRSSSPTLKQVTFSENTSKYNGGGLYNDTSSSPVLEQLTFSKNTADNRGGGMYNEDSSPTLTELIFLGNAAPNGGGMYNESASPTLTQVTFSGNTSDNRGGGMYNTDSSPTLTRVIFSDNTAFDGGGMYNENTLPTLTQVTFSENSAGFSGAGMFNDESSLNLTEVSFSNGSAKVGAGMSNYESSLELSKVTFSNNSAKVGAGIAHFDSLSTLTQVTFFNNSAELYGGGIATDNDAKSSLSIINSIFWGNTQGASDSEISNQIFIHNMDDKSPNRNYDKNFQIYYSILQGGTEEILSEESSEGAKLTVKSYGLVDTEDTKLASSLADNGGFVPTLALQSGSPAIDAGVYVQKSDDNYYYSEDTSTWYSTLDGDGLSNKTTPPDTAIDLTATDARGYAIARRPDLGAYEFSGKAP